MTNALADSSLEKALEELRCELQWIRDRLGDEFVAQMQVVRMRLDFARSKGLFPLPLVLVSLRILREGKIPPLVVHPTEVPPGGPRW